MKKGKDEFEIIDYPRINNINVFFVNLINRTPHIHGDMEFCYIMSGKMLIKTKADEIIADEGTLYFFNSNEPHSLKRLEGPSLLLSIQISQKICRDFFPNFENLYLINGDIFDHVSAKAQDRMKSEIFRIAFQYFRGGFGFQLPLASSVFTLFSLILEETEYKVIDQDELQRNRERHMRLSRITHYIKANLSGRITLGDLAELENLSPTYLSHFFRDNFDITFQEYVSNLRFEKAENLMSRTKLSILDICMESGFSDRKYMNKAFLRNRGCLPGVYRKELSRKQNLPGERKKSIDPLTSQSIYHDDGEITEMLERLRAVFTGET